MYQEHPSATERHFFACVPTRGFNCKVVSHREGTRAPELIKKWNKYGTVLVQALFWILSSRDCKRATRYADERMRKFRVTILTRDKNRRKKDREIRLVGVRWFFQFSFSEKQHLEESPDSSEVFWQDRGCPGWFLGRSSEETSSEKLDR